MNRLKMYTELLQTLYAPNLVTLKMPILKEIMKKVCFLVKHCQRIIEKAKPKWWVLENPSTGALRNFIGKPKHTYHPWHFGNPWTKGTGLWGDFNMPERTIKK